MYMAKHVHVYMSFTKVTTLEQVQVYYENAYVISKYMYI